MTDMNEVIDAINTEQEKLLCMMVALFLDENPDKTIKWSLHMVDGEWEHEVWIEDKKWENK